MTPKTHALFTSLYKTFGRRILATLLKKNGGDLEVAEEVLQETFISAYKSFKRFEHKSSYFTWLYRIAMNKLADQYRREVNRKSKVFAPSIEQFANIVDPSLSPEELLAISQLKEKVAQCFSLLPLEYKKILELKYLQDLKNTEISIQLNLSPRKLEGRLYRAKKALAKILSTNE